MKHTILGGGGAIGTPLAKYLKEIYGNSVRIVARNPKQVNGDDELLTADLLRAEDVFRAVEGSAVVYLCVGLKYSYKVWKRDWPVIMENVIGACKQHGTKLVFVDNVYMYAPASLKHMTEGVAMEPVSRLGKVRTGIVKKLLSAIERGEITGLVARSADFYGPNIRNGILNELVFNNLKKGKAAMWQCRLDRFHSFTYTPDAAKAIALLGNREDGFGRVWHLPTTSDKLTGQDWVGRCAMHLETKPKVMVLKKWMLRLMGVFVPLMAEIANMSYQYEVDYFFDSADIEKTYGIKPTPIDEALSEMAKK